MKLEVEFEVDLEVEFEVELKVEFEVELEVEFEVELEFGRFRPGRILSYMKRSWIEFEAHLIEVKRIRTISAGPDFIETEGMLNRIRR